VNRFTFEILAVWHNLKGSTGSSRTCIEECNRAEGRADMSIWWEKDAKLSL